jgi:MarR family transcriptional regulator, negative regulator of the multidrug operon emrRAB
MSAMEIKPDELGRRRLLNLLGAWATTATTRIWRQLNEEAGLSPSAAAALVSLRTFESRPVTIRALSDIVGLSHSACVRVVDRLAGAGFVERNPGRDDREVLLRLSERGRALADRVLAAREGVLRELVGSVSPDAAATLTGLVEGLLGQITEGRRQARWICRVCDHGLCHRSGGCPVDDAATALGQ